MTYFTFEDTLTQIGMGYVFLFLLGWQSMQRQGLALAVILVGYWLVFAVYPLPPADFDLTWVGVPKDWPHLMHGLIRALEQEHQLRGLVRSMVSQSVSARKTLRF